MIYEKRIKSVKRHKNRVCHDKFLFISFSFNSSYTPLFLNFLILSNLSSSLYSFATAEEQNIANNSKRLIQNAIILWNYMYITKKLQQAKNKSEKDNIIDTLKRSSIVVWAHINLFGIYDFEHYSKRIHRLIALDDSKGFMNN